MGKMKNLHTQGVKDIESYLLGRASQREDTIKMIQDALGNPALALKEMTPVMALAVMIGAIQWNDEVEKQATEEESWMSNT